MTVHFRGLLSLLVLAALAVRAGSAGDEPAKPAERKTLENLKLPPGAVVVICEDAKEALRLVPKAVVLTPEKYQELLDQVEQLKRQLKPEKAEPPSVCKLSGRVEDDQVRLRAHYEFRTVRPKTLVALGTARAWPTAATLDDQLPVLLPADEGLAVLVETPGSHHLTLDLAVPITTRGAKGSERGFDVGLPRAAVTMLESFDLPGDMAEARVAGRLTPVRHSGTASRLESVALGAAEKLDVAWRGPAAGPTKAAPLLAARGRVIVRVSDTFVTTDVELTLEVVRGETNLWRVRVPVPPGAAVEVHKPLPQDERVQSIRPPDERDPVLAIRLREPSAEPLVVAFQVRQARAVTAVPVGPFLVPDAFPQRGMIEVRAPAELRLRYRERGEISRRDVTEAQRGEGTVAAFQYWSGRPGGPEVAPLTLEVETVKGVVEARASHTLRLVVGPERRGWRVTSKFDITPVRTGVDRLEVRVPPEYQFDREVGAAPAELVEDVVTDAQGRVLQVKLAQRQTRPFSVTLPGFYALPGGGSELTGPEEAALELPRPEAWVVESTARAAETPSPAPARGAIHDRGGQVSVVVPEGVELVARASRPEIGPGQRETSWTTERLPGRVELAWQPQRPDLAVESVVDLTLASNRAWIRQRLRYQFSQALPAEVFLRVPSTVMSTLRVVEGGILDAEDRAAGRTGVLLDARSTGKERTVTLEYSYSVLAADADGEARADGRITIPLVRPDRAARGEARVRVWAEAGAEVQPSAAAWERVATEVVPEHDALPDLVLRGDLEAPLVLRGETVQAVLAAAVVERVLLQVTLGPGGTQTVRARFLLARIHAHELVLELPPSGPRTGLDLRLDGKRVPAHFVDAAGREIEAGRLVRLRVEPGLYPRPVVLDVRYQASAARAESGSFFQATLRPPTLQSAAFLGRCRWAVDLPPGRLPLLLGDGPILEQRWRLAGWLPAPEPSATAADLEQWLTGIDTVADDSDPAMVCWQASLAPLRLIHVPQQAWLLFCSLALLGLGLGLLFAPVPRWVFWSTVALVGVLAGIAILSAPGVVPAAAYGAQPGVLVLLLVVAVQAYLHRRQRRRLAFQPAFSRAKTGSSILRNSSGQRRREISTVDEPPAARGSSLGPRGAPTDEAGS